MSARNRYRMRTPSTGREVIVEAALARADAEGLDAVTFRRLAADLGVTPMALYRYVDSKEELLSAAADLAFADLELPGGLSIPNADHTPSYTQWNFGATHAFQDGLGGPLTARFDVVNVLDKVYEIRSGSGSGVFAPQYGAARGLFFGLSQDF